VSSNEVRYAANHEAKLDLLHSNNRRFVNFPPAEILVSQGTASQVKLENCISITCLSFRLQLNTIGAMLAPIFEYTNSFSPRPLDSIRLVPKSLPNLTFAKSGWTCQG
jgi:hypothetical protein